MERREGIDAPDQDAFAAFAGRASDGPVYMLNLLEFLPDGGAERYAEYGEAVAPLLERAGGKAVFAGRVAESLIGEGSWDLMLLVSYPSRQAFLDMVSSPEYQEIEHLRSQALGRSELRAMDALDPETPAAG
ncbi:MAG: DUF1330 domain-containing protein [Solirubrobacterales bacterium]|jgi:uncharacterized protein (DUF1330 family)